ncbi:MAG: EthD domain-containing protein [Myxococcota bacterium]
MFFAKKAEGMTLEALKAEQEKHVEMVKAFGEGVVTSYTYNIAVQDPLTGGEPAFDVVAELTATSAEAYAQALETPGGLAAREHAGTYLTGLQGLVVEEHPKW